MSSNPKSCLGWQRMHVDVQLVLRRCVPAMQDRQEKPTTRRKACAFGLLVARSADR
jgi:hypothetical protein